MTTKTELETAKEWWNNLSIGEQYKLTLKLNELKDFDSNILSFYQEEVLKNTSYFESPVNPIYSDSEVMDKQLEIEECRFIGDCKLLCLTSCLKFPNDKNISLINKGNNIQSADNDLIGKLKEAEEIIRDIKSQNEAWTFGMTASLQDKINIFLTTLADNQDLK